jgi:hypothetical protein
MARRRAGDDAGGRRRIERGGAVRPRAARLDARDRRDAPRRVGNGEALRRRRLLELELELEREASGAVNPATRRELAIAAVSTIGTAVIAFAARSSELDRQAFDRITRIEVLIEQNAGQVGRLGSSVSDVAAQVRLATLAVARLEALVEPKAPAPELATPAGR